MFSKRSWSSSIALAAIVAFTSWYSIKSSEQDIIPLPKTTVADGIAQNASVWQYDVSGQLSYQGHAANMTQYSNQVTQMTQLTGLYYRKGTPPWQAQADHAWISADNKLIRLSGHVYAHRDGNKEFIPLALYTTELFLYPDTHSLYTNKAVTLEEPGTRNITHAVGLTATEDPLVTELLSQVHSTYEATTSAPLLSH